jgi:hypothetical protein
MSATEILKLLGGHDGLYYRAYSPTDIVISAGIPPILISGWDYVFARYNKPQIKRFPNLGGRGRFVNNIDKSGIIEIGILQGAIAGGILDILSSIGIAIPILLIDIGSGGTSGVLSTSCCRTETPEWRREAIPGIIPFTFEATFMTISSGIQLPEEN